MAFTKEELVERGERARRLLGELDPWLEELEADVVEDWKMGADVAEREVAHFRIRALADIRGTLIAAIDAGEYAKQD